MENLDLTKGFDMENMDEASVKTIKQLDTNFKEALSEFKKGLNVDESLQKMQETIDEVKSLAKNDERLKAIEDYILEVKASNGGVKKTTTIGEQIESLFNDYVSTDSKGNKVIDFASALKTTNKIKLEVKEAGNITGGGVGRVDSDMRIGTRPVYHTWIFDVANVAPTASPNVMYVEKVDGEGGASFVEEGGLKPLQDWAYESKTLQVKKAAVRAKFTTEVMQDIPSFEEDLRTELFNSLEAVIETGILDGNGSGGNIAGVASTMPGYTLQGIETTNATYYDAIVAAYTQIKSSSFGSFTPTHVVMNPIDVANMKLSKDNQGRYIMPITLADNKELGLTVIASAKRPAGKFILGDFNYLNVRLYGDANLIFGYEGDDLSKNLMTVVAERRLTAYIKAHQKTAFVNDTFATVLAAITPSE